MLLTRPTLNQSLKGIPRVQQLNFKPAIWMITSSVVPPKALHGVPGPSGRPGQQRRKAATLARSLSVLMATSGTW